MIVTLRTAGMRHLLTVTSIDAESSVVFESIVDNENNPVPIIQNQYEHVPITTNITQSN